MIPRSGSTNSLMDVAGIYVGHAQDAKLRSGVTVLHFDEAMACAVDMHGGGPATRETDAVGSDATLGIAHAITLSGGSVFGLAAGDAVAQALCARGIGFSPVVGARPVPLVPGACIYDLANGGAKDWDNTAPYTALAHEALSAPSSSAIGSVGAGIGAVAGAWRGGLGTASIITDGITIAALVVVNPIGSPVMPDGRTLWAWPFELGDEFGGRRPNTDMPASATLPIDIKGGRAPGAATCIGAVAVSVPVARETLRRIAIMAQDGLARAIRPSHAQFDGDTLFALAPLDRPPSDPDLSMLLGSAAADCVARSVGRAVWAADAGWPGTPSLREASIAW